MVVGELGPGRQATGGRRRRRCRRGCRGRDGTPGRTTPLGGLGGGLYRPPPHRRAGPPAALSTSWASWASPRCWPCCASPSADEPPAESPISLSAGRSSAAGRPGAARTRGAVRRHRRRRVCFCCAAALPSPCRADIAQPQPRPPPRRRARRPRSSTFGSGRSRSDGWDPRLRRWSPARTLLPRSLRCLRRLAGGPFRRRFIC